MFFDHVHHCCPGACLGAVSILIYNRQGLELTISIRYFDNFPHGHYGTIRQQIWSLLHFPLQIAIVGVVEGSQQLALARYIINNTNKASAKITQYCQLENLDGQKLQDKLMGLLDYYELDGKLETRSFFYEAQSAIWKIGNATSICSSDKADDYTFGDENKDSNWPAAFKDLSYAISNGMYTGLGMKLPVDKLEKHSPLEVGLNAWKLVYLYFWSSFCLLVLCLVIFLFLIRRHKADLFDYTSVISRMSAFFVGAAMLALMANDIKIYAAIESPALLPVCVVLLFLILVSDKLSCMWCNSQLKKSGKPYALEVDDHGHDHNHGAHTTVHETGGVYKNVPHDTVGGELNEIPNASRWSMHPEDLKPLTAYSTGYNTSHHSIAMDSLHSTPDLSPQVISPDPVAHQDYMAINSAGYAPITTDHRNEA
jgi:hypothetical protein